MADHRYLRANGEARGRRLSFAATLGIGPTREIVFEPTHDEHLEEESQKLLWVVEDDSRLLPLRHNKCSDRYPVKIDSFDSCSMNRAGMRLGIIGLGDAAQDAIKIGDRYR